MKTKNFNRESECQGVAKETATLRMHLARTNELTKVRINGKNTM